VPTLAAQKAGGRASAILQRNEAISRYKRNPRKCMYCRNTIRIRGRQVATVLKTKFCNGSCAAKYNNKLRPRQPKRCKRCKCILPRKGICFDCRKRHGSDLGRRTKGDLFSSRSNWQSARSSIREHAAKTFDLSGLPKKCRICGYSKHVEISHKKAVSDFSDSTPLNEINALINLIPLCPNHHWEFDNGILKIR
jgi:hypothetical protein